MRQQQRMRVMTAMTRKIKSKGRVDANNSSWVSELLAADCKKRRLRFCLRCNVGRSDASARGLEKATGTPWMDEMEERSALCGRLCWRWKDSITLKKQKIKEQRWCLIWRKPFKRVSLPVVWAWATDFNFPRTVLRVLCGVTEIYCL